MEHLREKMYQNSEELEAAADKKRLTFLHDFLSQALTPVRPLYYVQAPNGDESDGNRRLEELK